MSHLYKGIIYNIHLSFFLQMLYLRARLSRRRSWLIVVGAGHFHPAVLVPRVGPVSEGGWCLGWREMGWYLHFAIIIMTMRKSFTSCIQTILKVNYLWGRIDFSLTHNIPRVSSTPLDNFQKPWNWKWFSFFGWWCSNRFRHTLHIIPTKVML